MKELYFISGLGADERVFQNLKLEGFNLNFVKWIIPLDNESIESYASRLSAQIKTERPVIIGLSFGGVMAIEIAKKRETEKVILISSAKTQKEIPTWLRFAGNFHLHKILPLKLWRSANALLYYYFGVSGENERKLLNAIFMETDERYLRWAVDQVLNWRNTSEIKNLKHIHGTKDKIFPLRFVKADKTIEGGEHFMVLSLADEVSKALKEYLS